jgi:hypothetical protein
MPQDLAGIGKRKNQALIVKIHADGDRSKSALAVQIDCLVRHQLGDVAIEITLLVLIAVRALTTASLPCRAINPPNMIR